MNDFYKYYECDGRFLYKNQPTGKLKLKWIQHLLAHYEKGGYRVKWCIDGKEFLIPNDTSKLRDLYELTNLKTYNFKVYVDYP